MSAASPTGSATLLVTELAAEGARNKTRITQSGRRHEGKPFDKGAIYKLLNNRLYLGEAVHKGKSYPGEHKPIVSRSLWDQVHAILAANAKSRGNRARARTPAPLQGLLRCTACDSAMTPSHTRRRGKLYRYYVCLKGMKRGASTCPVRSIAAGEIEGVVFQQVRRLLLSPEITARTVEAYHEVSDSNGDATSREREVHDALHQLDEVWSELFPAEQARILRLLVEGIDVDPDGIDVRLRRAGIHSLVAELVVETGDEADSDQHDAAEEVAA